MSQPRFDFARYMNVRAAYGADFAPDGRSLLFLSNITGVPQIWSQDLDGGWPRQLTYFEERISGAEYAVDGRILFSMDEGGNERDGLYLLDRDGVVTPLTNDPASIHRMGHWSPDGSRFAYAVNDRDPRFFDIYVMDPREGVPATPRLVHQSDHTNFAGAWSADGRQLVIRQADVSADADLYLLDLESGALRHLTPHEGQVRTYEAGFSRDGRSLFVVTDQGRDFMTPACLNLETLDVELLDETPWDAETLSVSPDGCRIAYSHNVDGYSRLVLRDVETGAALPAPRLSPGVIVAGLVGGSYSWSPDSTQLAFSYHSPTETMNVHVYALGGEAPRRLTSAPDGSIPERTYVTPELVRYRTFDDLQIPAFYYVSRGAGRGLPVVVLVHGGPEGQSRPIYNPTIQYFVNRGYAVFVPNVRGSTGYGKSYSHLDDVRRRMDSVKDLAACVEWLKTEGGADPTRIAVMGGSYGGFMTLAAVTNYPELWAAGVDIVGIANWRTFLENTGAFRRKHREAEYGNLEEDGEFLDEISPIHRSDQIRAPMIVLHGANDPRVPVTESEQIVRILKEREVPVVYHRYPDEGHGLVKLANKVHGYTAIGDFLDRYVMGMKA